MNYTRDNIERKEELYESYSQEIEKRVGVILLRLLVVLFVSVIIVSTFGTFGIFSGIIANTPDIASVNIAPSGFATFIYDSEGQNREVWGWRPIPSAIGPAPYDGDAEYCDGRMRLEFLNKVSSPKAERFRNITVVLEGEKKQVTFESVIQDFHIDKAKFSRVFANQVYMRCPCGPFGVEDGVARNIQAHDAAGVKPSVPRVPGGGSLVSLNAREISEVVYWLWRRKGKTDEYAGFVKAHPELFEPIAGEEEFRTELGRRLIGTWK